MARPLQMLLLRCVFAAEKHTPQKGSAMLLRALFILTLTACYVLGETEENVREQRAATAGGKLVLDVGFGEIDIAPGAADKVSLEAHRLVDFGDEKAENDFLKEAPIVVSKEGNVVTIRARRAETNLSRTFTGLSKMDAKFTVRVPKDFLLDLHTGGGCITVAEISGELKAATSGGKLTFTKLRGPVDARTSGGSIKIESCDGPLLVKTSGGAIHADGGSGSLDARTSGGSIEVRNFKGDAVVKTSGGRLQLEDIGGKVRGETAGGSVIATLLAPVPGEVTLSSAAGSIQLNVPAEAAIDIDARASVGAIANALPLTTTRNERTELRGAMNGGGRAVVLRAQAGSVSLRPVTSTAMR